VAVHPILCLGSLWEIDDAREVNSAKAPSWPEKAEHGASRALRFSCHVYKTAGPLTSPRNPHEMLIRRPRGLPRKSNASSRQKENVPPDINNFAPQIQWPEFPWEAVDKPRRFPTVRGCKFRRGRTRHQGPATGRNFRPCGCNWAVSDNVLARGRAHWVFGRPPHCQSGRAKRSNQVRFPGRQRPFPKVNHNVIIFPMPRDDGNSQPAGRHGPFSRIGGRVAFRCENVERRDCEALFFGV